MDSTWSAHWVIFQDLRKILGQLQLILASDDGDNKVFLDVSMTGFKKKKKSKAHLVRSQLPDLNEVGN